MEQHLEVEMAQPYVHLGAVSAPWGWMSVCRVCPTCALSCLVPVSPARSISQASPCLEMWGHICPHVSVCTALPCLAPPPQNPGNASHACPGDDSALSPSWRSVARPCRCSSAAPVRSLHPHVRLLFVSFSLRVGLYPVPTTPPPPAAPGAAPTGASHTHK